MGHGYNLSMREYRFEKNSNFNIVKTLKKLQLIEYGR